jgi:hypothetical protein
MKLYPNHYCGPIYTANNMNPQLNKEKIINDYNKYLDQQVKKYQNQNEYVNKDSIDIISPDNIKTKYIQNINRCKPIKELKHQYSNSENCKCIPNKNN